MLLSDEFVGNLAEAARRPNAAPWPPENVSRFRHHVQEAGADWASYVSPTILRREIKTLNGLAGLVLDPQRLNAARYKQLLIRKMDRVLAHVRTMSPAARWFLSERLQLRSHRIDLISADRRVRVAMLGEGETLHESFRDPLLFIDLKSLCPSQKGESKNEAYLWHLFSITQIERCRAKGRVRLNGKTSRQSSIATLYIPTPISRPARIRKLEMYLALAWLELTGSKPLPDAYYISFVEQVFRSLKIKRVDLEKLVAARGRQARQLKMNKKPILSEGT